MDALTRIHPAAADLLRRVDDTLARLGAPADHPIWPLLRSGGLLPSDAVAAVADWSPSVLADRAALLRHQASRQDGIASALGAPSGWEGSASAAFHGHLGVVTRDLAVAVEHGLALADCLDELAMTQQDGRRRLARVLAGVLSSAEAVTLTVGPSLGGLGPGSLAVSAATVATTVLSEVDTFWQAGLDVTHRLHLDAAATSASLGTTTSPGSLAVDI